MCPLHNRDLFLRESVEFIHQPIDLPVGRIDHPGERLLLVRGLRRREAFVQVEHLLDEGDHPVTAGDVGGASPFSGEPRQRVISRPRHQASA